MRPAQDQGRAAHSDRPATQVKQEGDKLTINYPMFTILMLAFPRLHIRGVRVGHFPEMEGQVNIEFQKLRADENLI